MQSCPKCGNQMTDRAYFCTECGTQLRELPPEIAALVPPEEQRQIPMQVTEKIFIGINLRQPLGPKLPFDFRSLEKEYGQFSFVKGICPGVYYIGTKSGWDKPGFGREYLVAMDDSPAISPEAKTFMTQLPTIPRAYLCEFEYSCKGRHIIQYESHKYLVDHGIPLPEGESLIEDRMFGMEVCPEYFGEFPTPTETPWGPPVRCDRLWNGLFWLKTEQVGWVLAVAYPLCTSLLDDTLKLAVQTEHDRKNPDEGEYGYRFYDYKTSCLPLYEMLWDGEDTWGPKIDRVALQNAILKYFPDYGIDNGWNDPNLPTGLRVEPVPGAGIDFYRFAYGKTTETPLTAKEKPQNRPLS